MSSGLPETAAVPSGHGSTRRRRPTSLARRIGAGVVGAYVVLAVATFVFFWPIYTAQVIPHDHWSWRMWLPSWI